MNGVRELRTTTGWVAAQNDMRLSFGLGDATMAEEVRIEWPSGTVQTLTDVAADQIPHVVEPPKIDFDTILVLSWHVAPDKGWILHRASNVDGPFEPVDAEVVVEGGGRPTVTVPTDERMRFYQLRQP